jgi:phosphopantetheinyl transferase
MLLIALARIDDPPAAGDGMVPGWMGDSERRRWADLPPPARRGFVASRALLRDLLRDATGVPATSWDVSAQSGAGPVVRALGDQVGAASIHASLSHRLGWVAAVVADAPVGVDIECERPSRSDARERAAMMLSPTELPQWESLPPLQREAALLTRWTAKEAWFKASPAQDSAWDFRRVVARACAPEHANVRAWVAAPLHVAICCADADELGRVECEGLHTSAATSTFWHVARAAQAD